MKSVSRRESLRMIGALLVTAGGLLVVGCERADGPPADLDEGKKSKRDVLKGLTTKPKKARKGASEEDTF